MVKLIFISLLTITPIEKKSYNSTLNGDVVQTTRPTNVPARLLGMWCKVGGNVTFVINKTTFYYPDSFKSYNYLITGNKIKIKYEDYSNSFPFKFKGNDILVMIDMEGKEQVYYRKK